MPNHHEYFDPNEVPDKLRESRSLAMDDGCCPVCQVVDGLRKYLENPDGPFSICQGCFFGFNTALPLENFLMKRRFHRSNQHGSYQRRQT